MPAGNSALRERCQYYITLWNPPEGCGASNGIGIALYNNLNPSGDNAEVPSTVKVTDGVHQLNYNNIGAFPLNINYGGSYGSIGHWAGATDGPVRVEVTYPAQSDGMDNTLSVGSALLHQAGDFNAGLPGTVVSPSVTTTQDGSDKTTVITFASFHGSDRVDLNLDTLRN